MKRRVEEYGRPAFIVPWALFLGVVCAFVACCVAGRRYSKTHHLTRVHRFHQLLSPEASFYPTASQVKQLALARSKKSCINVVIGGSSILNGCGQQAQELWSDKLATLLGPEYRVVNLGFRAAIAGEFGALGAEMIMNRRQVIFIADVRPEGESSYAVDGRLHRYFFWDAWHKKLIDRTGPRRTAGVTELLDERKSDRKFFELRTGALLDSKCFHNDLWNALTYSQGGTVWNQACGLNSFTPRKLLADNEPKQPPTRVRHQRVDRPRERERFLKAVALPSMEKDASGQWIVPPEKAAQIQQNVEVCFPIEELRRRTITIVTMYDPSMMAALPQDQREQLAMLSRYTGKQIEADGMRCVRFDESFTEDDFADYLHLTASGGEKLAEKMAPVIRDLAASLGYKHQPVEGSKPDGSKAPDQP